MLTSERVAELRAWVEYEVHDGDTRRALCAVLDAYEGERPRAASEVPAGSCRVLILHRRGHGRRESGNFWADAPYRKWCGDLYGWLADDEIIGWLPLPEVPK